MKGTIRQAISAIALKLLCIHIDIAYAFKSPDWGTLGEATNLQDEQCSDDVVLDRNNNKWWEDLDANNYTSVDIAIIGAGHAGLSTAIGLFRNISRSLCCDDSYSSTGGESAEVLQQVPSIRIYERDPKLRKSSQGMLSIGSNGNIYLARIHPDLPNLVSDAGCPFKKTIIVSVGDNNDGSETLLKETDVVPDSTLIRWHALRSVLADVLQDVLSESIDNNDILFEDVLETDHSLKTYKEVKGNLCGEEEDDNDSGGVFLLFENGNIVKAKIVIGADGTFSSVRRTMHPSDKPIYFGQMNWNAIVQTNTLPEDAQPPSNGVKAIIYNGGDGGDVDPTAPPRWSVYINDCGANHTFFQLRVTDMEKARAISGSKGRGGQGLPRVKAALLPIVQMSTHVSNILKALPEDIIFERAIIGRLPASTWLSSGGRVVLLGDAAHAMHPAPGQGANQAIGSAVALVEAITSAYKNHIGEKKGKHNNDSSVWLMNGLKKYDQNRRPKMDIFHRYVNMIGCAQSSGRQESELDPKTTSLWRQWLLITNDKIPPPEDGWDTVQTFDPLSIPEVSLV